MKAETKSSRADRSWLRRRRSISTAAAGALICAASAAAAPPAHAWSIDAGVTVDGFATCDTVPNASPVPAEAIWFDLEDTGEIEQASVDSLTRYFEVRFTNVPASGSWAAVWAYCAPPGIEPGWRYVADYWVSRPWLTSTGFPFWVEVQD